MNYTELITEALRRGVVHIQELRHCVTKMAERGRKPHKYTEVSFTTEAIATGEMFFRDPKNVGLIIWIPLASLEGNRGRYKTPQGDRMIKPNFEGEDGILNARERWRAVMLLEIDRFRGLLPAPFLAMYAGIDHTAIGAPIHASIEDLLSLISDCIVEYDGEI